MPMLLDLLTNIGASIIYDFGKAIKTQAAKHKAVQMVIKQLGTSPGLHDFPARYVEALVEFRFKGKDPAVMAFFREESLAQVFFDYCYGPNDKRNNEAALKQGIAHCVASLKVGDDVKAKNLDVTAELEQFREVFRQKVHESRSVKEVEFGQMLNDLQVGHANIRSDLREML